MVARVGEPLLPFAPLFTFKSAASAIACVALCLWTLFALSDFRTMANLFAAYFVFDVAVDGLLDATCWKVVYPRRKLELLIVGHHILGVCAMRATPELDVCRRAWQLVTVGELTSPLLYYMLWSREVLEREADRVQLALLSAWPVLRLLAPLLSFCLQARAVLAGGQHCTALNLLVTPLYIAMNGFYLAKLWRQRGRRRAGGKRL